MHRIFAVSVSMVFLLSVILINWTPVFDANLVAKPDPWDWNYCSSYRPCDAGEGDCDHDFDCTTGYCAQDVGDRYGQYRYMDICE